MIEKCDGRITRADGSWRPCDRPKGHGIDKFGFGCMSSYKGESEPKWNPRDTDRRSGRDRRSPSTERKEKM